MNSQHIVVKSQYSQKVNEFQINSQHMVNLYEILRFLVNLLQIHILSAESKYWDLPVYSVQITGWNILSGRIVFNSQHVCVKREYSQTVNEYHINSQHRRRWIYCKCWDSWWIYCKFTFCPQIQNIMIYGSAYRVGIICLGQSFWIPSTVW